MTNTKVIIALVAVAALALAAVGLGAAQLAQTQTIPGADANTAVRAEGFWGWIGNCFVYRANQAYEGQYVVPPVADNAPAPAYQGGFGYGYGYGPCWAR